MDRKQMRLWVDNDLLAIIDKRNDGSNLSDYINNIIRKELIGAKNVLHEKTKEVKTS